MRWSVLKRFELHARFFGRVQGVGFRSSILKMATDLHLGGWVKNNSDGSVELLAIGEKHLLEELLQRIDQKNRENIARMECFFSETERKFRAFEIRF